MNIETVQELERFIDEWKETPERNREAFLRFKNFLTLKDGVILDFKARPGVSYSLRASHSEQKERELFMMVDIIEDEPMWLSVCFYAERISDPEERADMVPGGLLGEDGMCFDLTKWDEDLIRYIEIRMDEACRNSGSE
ncbi:MAG: hypothetical protein JW882_12980 [Deltaproteobacteria bacterium]|nr:hypothetical protein [Deltaproteobacteria bacterium]